MIALRRRRLGVAAMGLLCGLALILANGGVVGQTMASWSDRVVGGSVFRTSEDAGKVYARAISTHGRVDRLVSVDQFGPVRSFTDAQRPLKFVDSGWIQGGDPGLFGVVSTEGRADLVAARRSLLLTSAHRRRVLRRRHERMRPHSPIRCASPPSAAWA